MTTTTKSADLLNSIIEQGVDEQTEKFLQTLPPCNEDDFTDVDWDDLDWAYDEEEDARTRAQQSG